ncbi:MAG TPA: redoxin family protein [Gemmatimonadales bacterium]|nr:redoxin family protein [Gemmatimonadales bacterium]
MTSRSVRLAGVLLAGLAATPAVAAGPEGVPSQATVFIDLMVEDGKGRPVLTLSADEIVLTQDGVGQRVAAVVAKEPAGRYELSYVPLSGTAGAVQLRVLRAGARVRGLDGPQLKPRLVAPLTPLESELAAILDARSDAADFPIQVAVPRFEPTSQGLHHTLAVEVPFEGLASAKDASGFTGRAQLFARVLDAEGSIVQRSFMDRTLSAATEAQLLSQRLLWTGAAHLKPGRYTLETVVRDPGSSRASVRKVTFDAPEVAPGIRVSSVCLLMPLGALVVRDRGSEQDDPFLLQGEPIMPTLELKTVAAPGAKVEFFAITYPDRTSADPVKMRLDILRNGNIVGATPISLPPPDERGEIRYAGSFPTRTLEPGDYKLRLLVQQGGTAHIEEVPFSVGTGDGVKPQLRFREVGSAIPAPGPAKPPAAEPGVLDEARKLFRRQDYDRAVQKLKKAEKAGEGKRAEVALLLAVAYYRMRASKDGEEAARRAIELSKDDPATLADAYTVLGRLLADAEKKPVHAPSQRLAAAESAFRKALEASGGASEAGQLALAETLYRLGRNGDAGAALQALAAKPGVTEPTAERARQLIANPHCATEACLPRLSFVSGEGRHVTDAELSGKVVLVSFWATWCAPCVAAMPDLKRVQARHANDPFVMVGVNLDHDRATMSGFLEANGVTWSQIDGDASERLSDTLGVRGIPAEYLFDHQGVLIGSTRGWGTATGMALSARISQAVGKAKKAQRQATPAP